MDNLPKLSCLSIRCHSFRILFTFTCKLKQAETVSGCKHWKYHRFIDCKIFAKFFNWTKIGIFVIGIKYLPSATEKIHSVTMVYKL